MYLDKDFPFYLFIPVQNEQREDVVANSRSEHMKDIIQNQLDGFGGKQVNCWGMMLLKIEFILFGFVMVVIEALQKSNSINLFKTQVTTLLI